jgi:hypothetical protein
VTDKACRRDKDITFKSVVSRVFASLLSTRHKQQHDNGSCIAEHTHTHSLQSTHSLTHSVTMSDNTQQLQLAVLGFSDQPSLVGNIVDGNGPPAISQHWFVYRDGQFHPAAPTMGQFHPAAPTIGPNLDSPADSDSHPNRQPNIRFVTVALLSGPISAYYTNELDTYIDIIEMGPFVTKMVEMVPDKVAEMVFSKVAEMVSSKVAKIGSGAFANNTISINVPMNVNPPQLLASS